MRRKIHSLMLGCAGWLLCVAAADCALAGPPAYLLLRRPESPQKYYQTGRPDVTNYDVRSSGYAYGYFGAAPRSHASRHFGYNRTYSQWSTY